MAVPVPSGVIEGDLILLAVTLDAGVFGSDAGISTPSGFTPVPSGSVGYGGSNRSRLAVFYKFAVAGESVSYTLNFSRSSGLSWAANAIARAFRGSNPASAIDASANSDAGGSQSSWPAPSVTPSRSDDLLVCLWAGTTTVAASSWPSGMIHTQTADAAPGALFIADQQLATASPTGTKTLSVSAATTWSAVTLALQAGGKIPYVLWDDF